MSYPVFFIPILTGETISEKKETFSIKTAQTLEKWGMVSVSTIKMENSDKNFLKKHKKTLDFFDLMVYTLI